LIGLFNAFQQTVCRYAEMLGDPCKTRNGKRKQAPLNSTEGFPMNSNQFRQAFLRQTTLKARILYVVADAAKNLTVIHYILQSTFLNSLTPNILSVII